MPEPLWTIVSVIVGGMLALAVDERKTRRQERQAARDELRNSIYLLMDDIVAMMKARRVLTTEAVLHSHTKTHVYDFDAASTRVAVQVVKFGGRPLHDAVVTWIIEINRQTWDTVNSRASQTAEEDAHLKVLFFTMLDHMSRELDDTRARPHWLSRFTRDERSVGSNASPPPDPSL